MNNSAALTLSSVGLDEDLLRQASQYPDCFLARVSVQHREHYRVIGENGEMQAVISGKMTVVIVVFFEMIDIKLATILS